jgi:hypothetical protein
MVHVINSPSQPCNEAAGVVAYDEFARLVQAANKQVNTGIRETLQGGNVHDQSQGKRHGNKEVYRGDIARLEGVMAKGTERKEQALVRNCARKTKGGRATYKAGT